MKSLLPRAEGMGTTTTRAARAEPVEAQRARPRQRHRSYVGPEEKYDLIGAMQFNLLTLLGLRQHHFLLDVGCGSLRGGKLLIPYLLPGRYYGLEPNEWLVQEGIKHEVGAEMVEMKQPRFSTDGNFTLSVFGRDFDFILAQSIFSHASPMQIERCLSEARRVMKPDSIFAATYHRGEQSYEGDEWVYPGGVTYTPEDMSAMIREQGLTPYHLDWPHPSQQTWVVITHLGGGREIPVTLESQVLTARLAIAENELAQARGELSEMEERIYVRLGRVLDRLGRRLRRRP